MTVVNTSQGWIVAVGGLDPGAVAMAYFETRRHMTTEAESGYKQAAPAVYMARAGRPYRAWDTAELQATIDMIPVCKMAKASGMPVRVVATPIISSDPLYDAFAAAAADAIALAGQTARTVATAAANAAEGGAAIVGTAALTTLLGPILLALSGLVVLYIFRKPIFRFVREAAK